MAAVVLEQVMLAYGRQTAVRNLSGIFEAATATAVVGPNGSGKSTLLKAIAGRQQPRAGRLRLDGVEPREVVYLAQEPGIDRGFPITVEDMIALGFTRQLGLFGGLGRNERARLAEAIAAVGLAGLERRSIASLSGGQFQRALFARAAVQDARVVLLDEPFSALDARTTADLTALVRGWTREGRVVVAVLHDLDVVRALCPRTLVLAREAVAWGPTETALTAENQERARMMALNWPREDAA